MTVQEAQANLETAGERDGPDRRDHGAGTLAAGTGRSPRRTCRGRREFQSVSAPTEKARTAWLKALAPKVLGRAGDAAKAIDSHFAALEPLSDEAEAEALDESYA